MLAPLRWRYGWQVGVEGHDAAQVRVQFTIRHLLVWTATAAALLGFATWIVSDWREVGESLRMTGWLRATIGVLVQSVVTLPLLIPSVGLVLSDGRGRRFGIWLLAMAILISFGCGLLVHRMGLAAGIPPSNAAVNSLMVLLVFAGFLIALLGSLIVVRLCGFRLLKKTGLNRDRK